METQKDYRKYSMKVLAVFGALAPDAIKPEHIRKYMDKRGLKSRTQANREKAFTSRVFRWGYERGLVKGNPCKGVKQFKEKTRTRYVTDTEYNAVFSVAPAVVQIAMEIAFLCCSRQADILNMRKSQLGEEGSSFSKARLALLRLRLGESAGCGYLCGQRIAIKTGYEQHLCHPPTIGGKIHT